MANWLMMIGTVIVTAVYSNVSITIHYRLGMLVLIDKLWPPDHQTRASLRRLRHPCYLYNH